MIERMEDGRRGIIRRLNSSQVWNPYHVYVVKANRLRWARHVARTMVSLVRWAMEGDQTEGDRGGDLGRDGRIVSEEMKDWAWRETARNS